MNWLEIFDLICGIPHTSGHEAALREKLAGIARDAGLRVRIDAAGNMAVDRPPSSGFEKLPVTILQAHMDMVPQTAPGVEFDFLRDPVRWRRDGDWISAGGRTSLGADDGIGLALALELLLDGDVRCGALRGVFTVEEETGFGGASRIDPAFLEGGALINLDGEDDAFFIVGCAGAARTEGRRRAELIPVRGGARGVKIILSGFPGGHSGVDIHKNRGNAIKAMGELLAEGLRGVEISELRGGTVFNAIPGCCEVIGAVPSGTELPEPETLAAPLRSRTAEGEKIALTYEETPTPGSVLAAESRSALVRAVAELPDGVLAFSGIFDGVVETSSNLATAEVSDGLMRICVSQRSMTDRIREEATEACRRVFAACGFEASVAGAYGAWEASEPTPLVKRAVAVWEEANGGTPSVSVMHAGVEVADFKALHPALEAVSVGPTVETPHSTGERLSVSSTLRVRKWLRMMVSGEDR